MKSESVAAVLQSLAGEGVGPGIKELGSSTSFASTKLCDFKLV